MMYSELLLPTPRAEDAHLGGREGPVGRRYLHLLGKGDWVGRLPISTDSDSPDSILTCVRSRWKLHLSGLEGFTRRRL